ncbi:winged helix-turn-helix transcriptional regulator [Rugamonas sp. DEMB1]|uniref:winged helix-turn-helix transcriptional regulator n=1 Tax=Rugamonas sp. DEMB1 TaxID=3039386 RepID=UPI00244AEADE|nr:helix-turn-helix domain-containing protein [Rugamonas sp. DEMB1]WGG51905.1 helix-turn-helix domain-containing protein [Rugamonas sp. DEMB1]
MAKRKSMKDDPCPVARALEVIGDRWAMLIVRDAYDGSRRFGDFQRNLGVARNILTDRLHGLTEDGVLAVQPASDGSAYQEYVLTAKGEQLFPVVLALRQWGEQHLFRRGEKHSLLLDKDGGAALPPMLPRSRDGRVLRAADTVVKKLPQKVRPPT